MTEKVFTTTVEIDGVDVPLVIRRLSIDAWQAFKSEFRHMQMRAQRNTKAQAEAVNDDEFEAALAREGENDRKATAFMRDMITTAVSAPDAGLVDEDNDDAPVVTGAELFEFYARNLGALSTILAAIFTEHLMTSGQKKALRLARDKPELTAANAAPSNPTENGRG